MQDIVLDSKYKLQVKKSSSWLGGFVRTLLISLLLWAIIALDFVLYIRSGAVRVFDGTWNLPVLFILGFLLIYSLLTMFLSVFSKGLQSLILASTLMFVVWGVMRQFLLVDSDTYLYVFFNSLLGDDIFNVIAPYIYLLVFGGGFIVTFWCVYKMSKTNVTYLVGILLLCMGYFVACDVLMPREEQSWVEEYHSLSTLTNNNQQKTVFLFMPNVSSNAAIEKVSANDVEKNDLLKNVELGFFMKHGFRVYPNAYLLHKDKNANLVELLNILDDKTFENHIVDNVDLKNWWQFKSPVKNDMFLRDKQLQNVYEKAGYNIYAYQGKNIAICKSNNQYDVDRCVSYQSLPLVLDSNFVSDKDNAILLFKQWLFSLGMSDNQLVKMITKYIPENRFVNEWSLPYGDLLVVNSLELLQKVLNDINSDNGKGVYFVYLDFPSNLLIFDEKCQIKPQKEWKTANSLNNIQEINEQKLCFWRVMDEFLLKLDEATNSENIVILQGVSGKKDIAAEKLDAVAKFLEQNTTLTAIRDNRTFSIDYSICNSRDILNENLFDADKCVEFNGVDFNKDIKKKIINKLQSNQVNIDKEGNIKDVFDNWLGTFKETKNIFIINKIDKIGIESSVMEELKLENAVRALSNKKTTKKISPETSIDKTTDVKLKDEDNKPVLSIDKNENVPLVHDDNSPKNEGTINTSNIEVEDKTAVVVETNDTKDIKSENSDITEQKTKPEDDEPQKQEIDVNETDVIEKVIPVATEDIKKTQEETESKIDKHKDVIVPEDSVDKNIEQTKAKELVLETDDEIIVVSDFLLEDEKTDEWELDPAKALGVSGDDIPVEKISVKVK